MRTPQDIIEKAKNYFDADQIVIPDVDKKAYLSSLKISDHISYYLRFHFNDFRSSNYWKTNLCSSNASD